MKDIYLFLDKLIEIAVDGTQYKYIKDYDREKIEVLISILAEFGFIKIKYGKIFTTELGKNLLKLSTD